MTDSPTFTDLGVDAKLSEALASKGITHPFPIQELTLPMALKGADIIGQARTGTGKTLAFGLPLLQAVDTSKQQTQAIVIVPTRELCLQVADDLTVGESSGITSIAVYGGVGFDEQIEALTGGVHVVVGTPGRTLDHLNRGNLDLSNVTVAVLDEADEMLDMGFLPDVERLLSSCPEDRQTLLFSATMPTAIVKLARRFMSKPTFMRAEAEQAETAPTVDQHFFLVHRMDKPRVLARLLQSDGRGGAFVFTRTKNMADRLVRELEDLKVSAIAVHGDLRQTTREKNLDRFRAGKADVLVATEVAARGLDVDNVTHVVNYDCPDDEKMYLHRIGRTARAGSSGVAVTFAEFNEVDRLNVIRKAVGATDDEVLEIFSTSDALTELFGLPAETPWDHMSRGGSRSGGSRSGGSRSGGSSGDSRGGGSRGGDSRGRGSRDGDDGRGDGRRKASSDGRPKSSRASQGGKGADRDRSRSESRASGSDRSRDGGRDQARSERSSRDGDDASTRTRTRTRTRSRSNDDAAASRSDDGRRDGDDRRDRSEKSDGSSSGRTRARRRGGQGGSDSGGSKDDSRGRSRSEGGSSGRDRGTSNRDRGSSGRDGGNNRNGRDDRDGGRNRGGGRDGGSDRGNDRDGNRNRGGNNRKRGGDQNRSGRGGDGGGGRSSSGANDPGARRTRRGDDARGEGTPRHSRRVQVEHLP